MEDNTDVHLPYFPPKRNESNDENDDIINNKKKKKKKKHKNHKHDNPFNNYNVNNTNNNNPNEYNELVNENENNGMIRGQSTDNRRTSQLIENNELYKSDGLMSSISDSYSYDTSESQSNDFHNTVFTANSAFLNPLSAIEDDLENLGENFEETPWLPPSLDKAKQYKYDNVYLHGETPLHKIKVVDSSDLGTSISIYFQFIKSICICLFVISVLSIPSLIFSYYGSRISIQDRDGIGFYKYTIGNIGYEYDSISSTCNNEINQLYNTTCIHILNNYELSSINANGILVILELLQNLCFYITILYLKYKLNSLSKRNHILECSVSDYTVMVTNLPANTNLNDIIEHFSNLYGLNKVDYKNRPTVINTKPNGNITNSGNPIYYNTWISDCILHKRIGNYILAFKNKYKLLNKLYHNRALMKMYHENTSFKFGPNKYLYEKAEKAMTLAAIAVDNIAKQQIKNNKIKLKYNQFNFDDNKQLRMLKNPSTYTSTSYTSNNVGSTINDSQYVIEADVIAAFITFQYNESMARCIDDYKHLKTNSIFYPNELKFLRTHQIKVRQAPEPDEIAWENLEVKPAIKLLYRIQTFLVSIVLSILCFFIVLQSTIYKNKFKSKIPSNVVCQNTIPLLYSNTSSSISNFNYILTRPSDKTTELVYDGYCGNTISNSFYAIFANDGNINEPINTYSFDSCINSDNLCPTYESTSYCPCVSTTDSKLCYTKPCYTSGFNSYDCSTFPAYDIGSCYCKDQVDNILQLKEFFKITSNLINQLHSNNCHDFIVSYANSYMLSYLSIIVVVIINRMLLYILTVLSTFESVNSIGKYQGSVIYKIFISMFVNSVVIVLLATGYIPTNFSILTELHVLQGTYKDFTASWYGNIGSYLTSSFILQSGTPIVGGFLWLYVILPIRKKIIYPQIIEKSCRNIVRQEELNNIEVGPIYNSTLNQAQLLAFLFFAMSLMPGIPLLGPLCFVYFLLNFLLQKLYLCRYCRKPPHLHFNGVSMVLDALPYALFIRLAVGCWMYSNPSILLGSVETITLSKSTSSNSIDDFLIQYSNSLKQWRVSAKSQAPSLNYLIDRLGKPFSFPLFIGLCIILIIIILSFINKDIKITEWFSNGFYYFFTQDPLSRALNTYRKRPAIIQQKHEKKSNDIESNNVTDVTVNSNNDKMNSNIFNKLFNCFKSNQSLDNCVHLYDLYLLNHPLRDEQAPYTSTYVKFIKNKYIIPNTCYQMITYDDNEIKLDEREKGWISIEDEDGYVMKVLTYKSLNKLTKSNNISVHIHNDINKRIDRYVYTYELIGQNSCNSYSMNCIPLYKPVIDALIASAKSIFEEEEDEEALKQLVNQNKEIDDNDLDDLINKQIDRNINNDVTNDGIINQEIDKHIQLENKFKRRGSKDSKSKHTNKIIPTNLSSSSSYNSTPDRKYNYITADDSIEMGPIVNHITDEYAYTNDEIIAYEKRLQEQELE